MKALKFMPILAACIAGAICSSCASPCDIIWNEGGLDAGTGTAIHTMEINNPPKGTGWVIWFSQFVHRSRWRRDPSER